jgi:3-hydroxybutyryl-CoA dehydrogenase/5-formyl-3-hydroxy-2-methylpyridine 4-carboxylate dehydrogenase
MGPGIAATFARHGFETRLADIKADVLDQARRTVDVVYSTLVQAGFMTQDEADRGHHHLHYTADVPRALRGVDFVIEAIPERLDLKQAFFREAEEAVAEDVVLASNTSGIPITDLARAVRRPERVVGMHWSNPPHLIPVIEVVRGAQTGDEAVEITRQLAERIGMLPVLVRRDVPGFVENRILYAIMREALYLLEEGIASAEDIDTIVRWGLGYKLAVIGPLELLDVAGLDIYHSVASYLNPELSRRTDVSPLVREKVARGELGVKTGRGLFTYDAATLPDLTGRRLRRLVAVRRALASDGGS